MLRKMLLFLNLIQVQDNGNYVKILGLMQH